MTEKRARALHRDSAEWAYEQSQAAFGFAVCFNDMGNAQQKAQGQDPAQPDTVHDMRLSMPDGHEVSLETEQQPEAPKAAIFKIGDQVRVWKCDKGYGHLAFCIGRAFPVIASCFVYGGYVYLLEGNEDDGIFLAPEHCLWISNLTPKYDSEQAPEPKLKPFDRVLVRNENGGTWACEIFSH